MAVICLLIVSTLGSRRSVEIISCFGGPICIELLTPSTGPTVMIERGLKLKAAWPYLAFGISKVTHLFGFCSALYLSL